MLENQEFRRCGGVPLGPFGRSIEPDREGLLGVEEALEELVSGWPWAWTLTDGSAVPAGLRRFGAGGGIDGGCAGAGAGVLGGVEYDVDLLTLSEG